MPTTPDVRRFTIRATSGLQATTSEFALAILPAPMVITNALLPDATLGASYTQFLDVAGGDGSVNWSLVSGALPAGISLSGSGLLSGVAATLGTSIFTVRAIRGALTAERALSLAVVPAPLVIATMALPAAKVGDPFSVTLESRGGSGGNTWSLAEGTLPAGLTLAAGGEISGTPTIAGTSAFTVAVVSGAQRATRGLALTVDPAGYPLTALITTPGLVFVPLIVQIARGGTVTWRFGADPHNAIFVPTPGAPADINIVSDVDVSRTFPTAGVFRYDCTIHPGMSGVIEVKP
jgi:plastocyanin